MENIRTLLIAGSIAALTACGGATTDDPANVANSAGNGSADNVAAPANDAALANDQEPESAAAATPATTAGGAVSREYLVGRWTEDGDCSQVIAFAADGSFTFPWGDSGRWELNGDRLRLTTNDSDLRVAAIDPNRIEVTYAGGRVAQSTRC